GEFLGALLPLVRVLRQRKLDHRSDLYSLGVILFELLSGRLPFTSTHQHKLLAAHVQDPPPRFHKIGCAHIPPGVEAVVQLALSKYPNERQQSAQELAEAYGRAARENIWERTAPADWTPTQRSVVNRALPGDPERGVPQPEENPYRLSHTFEVSIPERLAAAKLRGFMEDVGGQVLASEPGLIRMRVGVPKGFKEVPAGGSNLFRWVSTLRKPSVSRGQEPVEIELHMEKPDPAQPRLSVVVAFGPLKEYMPREPGAWRARCDMLHTMLRQYLGA
ncbi:MAG TPA: hypothetical protein VKE74_26145, partial [Gemmataceae bacterium]|nr:hypothetical protein [Gemmataceae bacterium]